MFENSAYYQRYNNHYGYQNYSKYYNPTFTNRYYSNPTIPNMDYTMSKDFHDESINSNDSENAKIKESDTKFRLGPVSIGDNKLDIFGFSLAIDDLIIIAIIILLFLESDKNYTLLIVLGLMLFNFSFSDLNLF